MNYFIVIFRGDGMLPAAAPVTLTASERKILMMRVRGAKTPYRDRVRAQIVLEAAVAGIMSGSPLACGSAGTRCASGAAGSRAGGWPGWRTGPELKRELEAQALACAPVSVSSLLRILAENPVKPWQYQS
jgi:hypothetical protein